MGKPGRPPAGLEDYHEWEQRLERFDASDANLELFCLQEGVSRSTLYRWRRRLDNGIPESLQTESVEPEQHGSNESLFLPVSLKSSRVELTLPNGGVVRLPSDVSKEVLVALVRVLGSLRPWKSPEA